jgi:16S rRNA (guanine966-N2)-methyltransferase
LVYQLIQSLSLRIISGEHKGRRIPVPGSFKARPTTDFAREALFNILANHFDFESIGILDLFSGTGSISYEFASRGSERVDLIEINPVYSRFIRKTAQNLELKQIRNYTGDIFRFVPRLKNTYDIIFADPPYDLKKTPEIPDLIFKCKILSDDGWFILEHGKKFDFSGHAHFRELRRYGSVHFSIFQ